MRSFKLVASESGGDILVQSSIPILIKPEITPMHSIFCRL